MRWFMRWGFGVVTPWALAFAIASSAADAQAGGTTETGSSGDESSGSDTSAGGSGSTGAADSTDGGSGDGAEGSCGECSGHDGAVEFTNLSDGAVVASPFEVDVHVATDCGCDDCGCFETYPNDIRIEVDGSPYGEPCGGNNCGFELALSQGPHVITAYGIFDYWETSAQLQVTVEGSSDESTATVGSATADGGASESSGGAGADDDTKAGCGCRADGDANAIGSLALGLLVLLRRRRLAAWATAAAAASLSTLAHAGGTSTGTGDTGTTSDSGSTGETTTEEGNGDEFCGDDCGGLGELTIDSPVDGAVVTASFSVTLTATENCYCDTCGCFLEDVDMIRLSLDGETVGSCDATPCEIAVNAAPGAHTLSAFATWGGGEDFVEIAIQVAGDDATDTGGSATSGATADDGSATADGTATGESDTELDDLSGGADENDDGCACRGDAAGPSPGGSALLLLTAFARRRGRARR